MSQILRRNSRYVGGFKSSYINSLKESYFKTALSNISSYFSCRINFIYRSLKPVVINATKVNYSVLSGRNQWNHCGDAPLRRELLQNPMPSNFKVGSRSYGMLVVRALRGVLKLRYLLLGGAVGGTMTMNKVSSFEYVFLPLNRHYSFSEIRAMARWTS